MEIKDYWIDIDQRLDTLLKKGYVKLPSLSKFPLDKIADGISSEMGDLTFKELTLAHKKLLNDLKIDEFLAPKLFLLAKKNFSYSGDISNQYHVSRKVIPGNSKEMYRAHFDSHIFTMVLPIKIPKSLNDSSVGDLIFFPNARSVPKNEIQNFIGKAYYKKYASKDGIDRLANKYEKMVDNFNSYEPILFVGNTTLHTNMPVSKNCSSYRLTCLAHFFDPSPKYGVGNILRFFRNR